MERKRSDWKFLRIEGKGKAREGGTWKRERGVFSFFEGVTEEVETRCCGREKEISRGAPSLHRRI